jgi:hypothetical protein
VELGSDSVIEGLDAFIMHEEIDEYVRATVPKEDMN